MDYFAEAKKQNLALDETVAAHLANRNSAVIFAVSGGKDGEVATLEGLEFLNRVGYPGEIGLIHSHLGEIEHHSSLRQCRKLAEKCGLPLIVVYPKVPMIERWENRWVGIIKRFVELERVKIMMPFSAAGARFCTSDEKVTPITQELKRRFPGRFIINVVGIRREESKERAKKPISQVNDKLTAKKTLTAGCDWFPIIEYQKEDVWLSHRRHNFRAHEAYKKFGMERISCSFCVLASKGDLRNSLRDKRNHLAFHRIVALEITSGFSFRQNDWLADYGTELLSGDERAGLQRAKEVAAHRKFLESKVDKALFFVKDFPTFQPSMEQAENLAEFRRAMSDLYNIDSKYLTGAEVWQRYADLLVLKSLKKS